MIAYSHYIWDFDGTLFDSYPHSIAALCAAAEHYGIPADPNAVSQAIHINFATAYRLLGLTLEQLALFHDLRARRDFLPPVTPFPGVQKALEALCSGVQSTICSPTAAATCRLIIWRNMVWPDCLQIL